MAGKGCAPSMSKGGGKAGSMAKGSKGSKGGFVSTPASFTKKK